MGLGKLGLHGLGLGQVYGSGQLSDRVLATRRPNLVAFWPMNETSGAVANDLSGNGRHGSYTGVTFNVPGANLIANPGFETAGAGGADVFSGWTEMASDGTIERTTTAGEFRSGVAAAKITCGTTTTTAGARISVDQTVIPGGVISISFWVRGDGTNAGRYSLFDVSHTTYIVEPASTGVTGTTYTQINLTRTIPDGCVSIRLTFVCPPLNGAIAYFDDVSLVAVSANGIGDGGNAPYFDGVNDYVNIYSTSLAGAFNPLAGTLMCWAKVSAPGVWTDGALRYVVGLRADANNRLYLARAAANNALTWFYLANNVSTSLTQGGYSATGWMALAITWGAAVQPYLDGVAVGAPIAGPGVWSGAPGATTSAIGAANTTPASVWSGTIGDCALWSAPLIASEIAALARL